MKYLFIFLMFLFPMSDEAQTLTGKVVDEKNAPLYDASVVVLSRKDSSFVKGVLTAEDGHFSVNTGSTESAILRISSMGYVTLYKDVQSGDCGTVVLKQDSRELQGITVRGNMPQYKMAAGGMTVDVQHSVLSQLGTAVDVLGQLPLVNIAGDGSISVVAKGTPEIYINNKKVQDNSELQHLKSTDIKSIDVITSPSSIYQATVNSVIRIKTFHVQGDGFSFRMDDNVSYNRFWGASTDNYLKYRRKGLEIFANPYFYAHTYTEDNSGAVDIQAAEHVKVDQYLWNHYQFSGIYGCVGGNYDFDENNSVGATYTCTKRLHDRGYSRGGYQNIYINDLLDGHIDQTWDTSGKNGPKHEFNAYYTGKAGKMDIDANLSYIWKKTDSKKFETEDSKELDSRTITTDDKQHSRMLAEKVILSYPIGKGSLDVGSEISHTYSKGEYTNDEDYVASSLTEIRENHTAGFAEYNLPIENWSFDAGLRYEYVKSDYYSFGVFQDSPSRKYSNWYPSLSASWKKNQLGLQMSYVCKTDRPSYNSLRDEVQYDNRYFYEGGNPYLRPSLSHHFDFSLIASWFSLGAGYTYNKDVMIWCVTLYNDQAIGFLRNMNFNHSQDFYVSAVASPKFGWYQPTFEIDGSQQIFDARKYGAARNLNHPGAIFSLKNRFVGKHDFSAYINLSVHSNQYSGFECDKHTSNFNIQLIKSFFDKSLTLNLKINDILKDQRDAITMYGINALITRDAYTYSREASLTVTYNFNAYHSKYKGTGAGNAESNRL